MSPVAGSVPTSVGTGIVQRTLRGWTRWAAATIGLAVALEGLAWLTGALWLHVLAVLALATLAVGCVEDPRVGALQVIMTAPLQATVGDQVTHRFSVRNAGRRRTASCHLRSHAHGYADVSVLLPSLPAGGSVEAEVVREATSRGYAAGSVLALSSSAPLGMRWATALATVAAPLVVRPRLSRAGRLDLDAGPTSAEVGTSVVGRDGDLLHGVREWRSGDDARQIHWRTSARRGSLAVVERESVQQTRLVLVAVGPSTDPSFEGWVSMLATTAVEALQHGASVALLAAQPDLSDLVDASRDSALDWAAALDQVTGPDPTLVRRAVQAAGPGGTVVLCGPSATDIDHGSARAAARAYGVRWSVLQGAR